MKLPISIAKKLVLLKQGEKVPLSTLKHSIIDIMIENGVLKKQIQGRSKTLIFISNNNLLTTYLKNHFGIDSLDNYIEKYGNENLSRAEAIDIASDSKLKSIRTFKGFLVNCYEPLECFLNNNPITIQPQEGTFTFIYDFESFIPPTHATVVGIENPENFRFIAKQKGLFECHHPLFVSRYPQSKDLIKWLQIIPNKYLHFGDFDFAGLNIYFNEYKTHLNEKASFFLPTNIEELLSTKGNRDNYNNQTIQFNRHAVEEKNIIILLGLIEKYKKGLEQEIFAK